jgi:hypothetical protein
VQLHQQLNVKIVIPLDSREVGSSQLLARKLAAEIFHNADRRLYFFERPRQITLVPPDARDPVTCQSFALRVWSCDSEGGRLSEMGKRLLPFAETVVNLADACERVGGFYVAERLLNLKRFPIPLKRRPKVACAGGQESEPVKYESHPAAVISLASKN